MKRRVNLIIHVVVLAVIIVGIVFLMRDASHSLRAPGYDASAPTQTKFARLARWMPEGVDFLVAADVPRALANPMLSEKLKRIASGRTGVAAELISALIDDGNAVGMIAIAGTLGDVGSGSDIVILAQGDFDEKVLLPAIRTAMSAGHAGLTAQNVEWATIYSESDSRDPFGFILLDKRHLAVGNRKTLLAFYEAKPEGGLERRLKADDVIFGYVSIGPRLKGSAPKAMYLPESAFIASSEGITLTVTIPCDDPASAESVRMFLEGLKSLMTIQEKSRGDGGLASLLSDVKMEVAENDVILKGRIIPLIDLWAKDSEAPAGSD